MRERPRRCGLKKGDELDEEMSSMRVRRTAGVVGQGKVQGLGLPSLRWGAPCLMRNEKIILEIYLSLK